MRILLTNDDGMQAPGLWHAAQALQPIGEVIICSPDREQSGIGTAVTLHNPIRVNEAPSYIPGVTAYAVEGTPSDAVILALETLVEGTIDLVVSGINPGANLGWDMFISGTVGAALQGYLRGISALAISVTALTDVPYEPAALLLRSLVPRLMDSSVPKPFLLSVNLPKKPLEEIEGIEVTRMAREVYLDQVQDWDDARRPYYWISRSRSKFDAPVGTDLAAVLANRISITPLHGDLSSNGRLPPLQEATADILEQIRGLAGQPNLSAWGEFVQPPWATGRARGIRPLRTATPRLVCSDLEATIAFYQRLGFWVDHEFKDQQGQRWEVTLRREGAVIRYVQQDQYAPELKQALQEQPRGVGVDVHMTVLNVERLYQEFQALGVTVPQEMQTTFSGAREFAILDPNGYRLVFGQPGPPR